MEQMENQSPSNPADRPLVTFDTNIVYALRDDEPDSQFARQLLAFNRVGVITINITLSTAFEGRRAGEEQERHHYYVTWLQEQGIDPGNIFTHALTIGFRRPGDPPNTSYFDHELEIGLYARIHQILFPNIPSWWFDYLDQECTRLGIVGTRRKALIELDDLSLGRYIPPTP